MRSIILILLLIPTALAGQDYMDSVSVGFSGFVRGDYWYETRQNFGACEELFTLYPKPEKLDATGKDINAESVSNMAAIATRLRTTIKGPEIWGAQSVGYVEADFTSNLGTDGFRFRHAFVKLDWENAGVLLGRYWHPMFVTDAFPTVLALNTGAPFQVFNRSPQLRYTQRINNFRVVGALTYQGDYASYGPSVEGSSADYFKNASLPEVNLRLEYLFSGNLFGIGGSYKVIQPRLKTSGTDNEIYQSDELVPGSLIMTYLKVQTGKFTYKYRAMIGQNVYEHLLLGGYAVSDYEPSTGREQYTPYSHLYTWGNIIYGRKLRFGLFGGFAKNMGTMKDIQWTAPEPVFARGSDIDYGYRVAPHVQYRMKNLNVGMEMEYTTVAYGTAGNNGIVKNAQEISNLRVLLNAVYLF